MNSPQRILLLFWIFAATLLGCASTNQIAEQPAPPTVAQSSGAAYDVGGALFRSQKVGPSGESTQGTQGRLKEGVSSGLRLKSGGFIGGMLGEDNGKLVEYFSGQVKTVSDGTIEVQAGQETRSFVITDTTKICVRGIQVRSWRDLTSVKEATVETELESHAALEIYDAPVGFSLDLATGIMKMIKPRCIHIPRQEP